MLQLLDLLLPEFVLRRLDVNGKLRTDVEHPFNFLLNNLAVNTNTDEFAIRTGRYMTVSKLSHLSLRDLTAITKIAVDLEASMMSE